MHGLDLKHRHLNGQALSKDLAAQIVERSLYGKIVIVTDRPASLLASVRKQWLRKMRKTQIERARTLKAARILELSNTLAQMQSIKLSAKAPTDSLEADVTFATADDFIKFAPDCYTMYVTYGFPKEKLYLITSWMPKRGVVIIYE